MTTPALILGDFNLNADEVEAIAEQLDAAMVVGHGVDHALIVGNALLESVHRHLPAGPSDHGPLLVTVTVDGYRIRVLWWNVYVGSDPLAVLRAVCEFADQWQPDIIALGEAKRCRRVLGRVPGYRHRQGLRGEAANMAVLVRRNVRLARFDWLRMTEPWIGPRHDLRHGPRSYPRALVADRTGKPRLRVLPVHFPTGGYHGRNVEAVLESVRRVVKWGAHSKESR